MSITPQNALPLLLDVFKLSPIDRPPQAGQHKQHKYDRQRNQQIQNVHGQATSRGLCAGCGAWKMAAASPPGTRARRAAFITTSSELSAIPSPASQAGM